MKKIILSALLTLFMIVSFAQSYNNEWIDYSKTYYKFKISTDGIYRINQPTLAAAGLGSANAQYFELWRNGQIVPIYTTVSSGPLPANGFIEFYGLKNDGKADKALYRKPEYQLNDKYSFETDTATYFLTVNPATVNSHYTIDNNDVSGNSRPAEPYFMYTVGNYFKDKINPGLAAVIGTDFVYSSSYDKGEGYTSGDLFPANNYNISNTNLNVEPSGPAASFNYAAFGNFNSLRTLRVSLNGSPVLDQLINYYENVQGTVNNIPVSLISGNTATFTTVNDAPINNDRVVVYYYELVYPRKFVFDGSGSFPFVLPSKSDTSYLQISNFNHGNTPPVLYDLTNQRMIVGDISDPSFVKIVLPPSEVERKMVLLSRESSNIRTVNGLTSKTFIDYSTPNNQGDYLIISNAALFNDGSGNNFVDQYRQYRSTAAGGSYTARIYDIQELTDQFAFGIKNHPFSIKNFLRFARNTYSQKPKSCFIIGKGVTYPELRRFENFAVTSKINLIPTFGWPASDNFLAAETSSNPTPATPIGRLSVVYPYEIKSYLDKVKEYESTQNTASCTIADKAWMKNVMHIIGADDAVGNQIDYYMSNPYTDTIQTAQFGGKVSRFRKTSNITIQQINNDQVPALFKEGLSLVTYFGHSSPTTLQFSLDEPKELKNPGKYPFFIANGCQAGNNYLFDTLRLVDNLTLSEKFVLTDKAGSIGFLASTHLGIVNFLHFYTQEFYTNMSKKMYGKTFGEISKGTVDYIMKTYSEDDFYNRQHSEQINLNGDPAIHSVNFAKPDYAVEPSLIGISPQFISIAESNFKVSFKIMNIGKGVNDSIRVIVKRQYPVDGHEEVIYDQKIPGIQYADSMELVLPILPLRDKGVNKLTFIVDADNAVDEICETNNTVTKDVFIYENELRPIYPVNYAIINKQNITFSASTANVLQSSQQYLMELDTTMKFNSPLKVSANVTNSGGLISFTPNVNFIAGIVYYWRTGVGDPSTNNIIWNNASFIYLPNSSEGFNQSHYYQYLNNSYYNIFLDSTDRTFKYKVTDRNLLVRTGSYPYFVNDKLDMALDVENINVYNCTYFAFQITVLDGKTLRPWKNFNQGSTGMYGSRPICARPYRNWFEYSYLDSSSRRKAMDFLKMVPDSNYIIITNTAADVSFNQIGAAELMSDTSYLGSGVSLYHTFKQFGFDLIDSFRTNKPMIFAFKKNDISFSLQQYVGGPKDWLVKNFNLRGLINTGQIESPWFGPVKSWDELHWDGTNLEAEPDSVNIEVIGQTKTGDQVSLAIVAPAKDTSISFIDASVYPFVKLRMSNTDTLHSSPNQLKYWRLAATTLPEGVLSPNITYEFKDVVEQGENVSLKVAFKNISDKVFEDSLIVKCVITDKNNVPHDILIPKLKTLAPGEVATISFVLNSKDYYGNNSMFFMVNPDGVVPEKYLFNNFFYKNFVVNEDKYSPVLDVTFDGIRILSKDIVSSKPNIQIKLKDNSQYLLLNDTSLFRLQVRFPNGTLKDIPFNSAEIQFTPAVSGTDNNAVINYFPTFLQDGQYELLVTAKDVNGNKAGQTAYRVLFNVINKPMISNMLNYPNPFTTSTAFVFTVTGSEIPQNIRIQILTITGKIVREITKEELGPIHIGRNITEFKWDGTDQFGQKLGNGVYLYRVITNLNGKSLDKYKAGDDMTDKYFNNGYGKMYLMR
ncbi:MAG: hypothetical protein HYX40_11555 [Sphingobacteriales bacterium]|nr:hypothetical protein [Sphingobacteriales bacterium]